MAQDNNTNKFNLLTNEQKKNQIKHLKFRISLWEKNIKELKGRKMKGDIRRRATAHRRGRKPKCSDYHYEKRISRYTELINVCLKNIKEIEDTM